MVAVRVNFDLGPAQAVLSRYRELFADPLPLMQIAGGILENSTRERFAAQHGPGGSPWKPSWRAQEQGGRTLIDKGGLLASVTNRASSHRVEWGVIAKTESAKHAATQQYGDTITPKKGPYLVFRGANGHVIFARSVTIPARPFLGIDEQDRADLNEAWTAYLEGLADGR